MRIGIDATAAVRQYAGVGRFARGLLGGLAQVDAHNHYVLLTTGKSRIAVDTAWLPSRRSWMRLPVSDRLATIAWHRLRAPLPPTALLGGVSLFFTPDYALPPLGKTPGVVTVHDLSFLLHPECADEGLRRYLSMVVPRSVRRAAAVCAVSATTAQALRDLLGVPLERIHIVPNGVDARFHASSGDDAQGQVATLRHRYGLVPGYLLAVGTLEPRKNLVRLLQAFALLRRRGLTVRGATAIGQGDPSTQAHDPAGLTLVIAGREGWLYEPIFREVARLGLTSAVRFLTRVEDDDLIALYRGAAVFVHPALYEGFGIPPLEALACGVPVAASTGGALAEVLGDAALPFDPLDVEGMTTAIERLWQDDQLRAVLRARGLARAACYTWEQSARAALALFEQLAA